MIENGLTKSRGITRDATGCEFSYVVLTTRWLGQITDRVYLALGRSAKTLKGLKTQISNL